MTKVLIRESIIRLPNLKFMLGIRGLKSVGTDREDEKIRILKSSHFLHLTDIIHSGESLFVKKDVKMPVQGIVYSYVVLSPTPTASVSKSPR